MVEAEPEEKRTAMDQAETCADRRSRTLEHLAAAISEVRRPEHVVLVAVDGVDGAGKTVFANELAEVLKRRRIVVLRASVDGFHHSPSIRYQRGRRSPEGFFLDSHDYGALRRLLLEPLAGSGERRVVRRIYDVKAEEPVEAVRESVGDVQVLLFDGIFLHRPELRDLWDLSVFLEVDFEVSIPRGAGRGYGDPDPNSPANRRYVEGQRLYLATCRPRERARTLLSITHVASHALGPDPDDVAVRARICGGAPRHHRRQVARRGQASQRVAKHPHRVTTSGALGGGTKTRQALVPPAQSCTGPSASPGSALNRPVSLDFAPSAVRRPPCGFVGKQSASQRPVTTWP